METVSRWWNNTEINENSKNGEVSRSKYPSWAADVIRNFNFNRVRETLLRHENALCYVLEFAKPNLEAYVMVQHTSSKIPSRADLINKLLKLKLSNSDTLLQLYMINFWLFIKPSLIFHIKNSATFISLGIKCNKWSRAAEEENISAAEHLIIATENSNKI